MFGAFPHLAGALMFSQGSDAHPPLLPPPLAVSHLLPGPSTAAAYTAALAGREWPVGYPVPPTTNLPEGLRAGAMMPHAQAAHRDHDASHKWIANFDAAPAPPPPRMESPRHTGTVARGAAELLQSRSLTVPWPSVTSSGEVRAPSQLGSAPLDCAHQHNSPMGNPNRNVAWGGSRNDASASGMEAVAGRWSPWLPRAHSGEVGRREPPEILRAQSGGGGREESSQDEETPEIDPAQLPQTQARAREAALRKYKNKRERRDFSGKIRYKSRKELADVRPRVKGQFVRRSALLTGAGSDSFATTTTTTGTASEVVNTSQEAGSFGEGGEACVQDDAHGAPSETHELSGGSRGSSELCNGGHRFSVQGSNAHTPHDPSATTSVGTECVPGLAEQRHRPSTQVCAHA